MAKGSNASRRQGDPNLKMPFGEILSDLADAEKRLEQFGDSLETLKLFANETRRAAELERKFDAANRRFAFFMRTVREGKFAATLGEGVDKLNKLRGSVEQVATRAAVAFATATTSIMAFTAQASPDAINTFTGSLQLVSMQIGQGFIPYIKEASRWIQDVYKWFGSLSQEQKENAARWVLWGVAAAGIIMILPKVITLVGGLIAAVKALGVALSFLAAHPVIAALAALGVAVTAVGAAFAFSTTQAAQMDQTNQRLASGSMGGQDLLRNQAYWNLKNIKDHKQRAEAADSLIRREEDWKFAMPPGSAEDKKRWAADSDANIAVARKFRDYANKGQMFDPFRNKAHRKDDMLQSMQGAQPSYQSLANAYQSIQLNALGKDPMQAKILEEQQKGNKLHAEGNLILEQIKDKSALPAVVP